MYLQSILIVNGSEQDQQEKIKEILSVLGFPNLSDPSNHPNVFLVAPEQEKIAIGIDKIREIRSWLATKSINAMPKIVVIKSAESLTESAQNSLLKTLEEPPEKAFVILAATRIDFFLPTIISRCQVIELSENPNPELTKKETADLNQILTWIGESNIPKGFDWAKGNSDRKSAIDAINKLLIIVHQDLLQGESLQVSSGQSRLTWAAKKLFEAKKCLSANTNVRLTLENLFID